MPQFSEKAIDIIEFGHDIFKLFFVLLISLILFVEISAYFSNSFSLMVDGLRFLIKCFNQFIGSLENFFKNFLSIMLVYLLIIFASNLTEVHLFIEFSDFINDSVKSFSF